MISSILYLAAAFVSVAAAQTSTMITSVSAAGAEPSEVFTGTSISIPTTGATSFPIVPTAIPLSTRNGWCAGQYDSCNSICGPGGWSNNTCIPATLTWNCTCKSIATPNLGNFNQTIPFFECTQYFQDCIAATTMSQELQDMCLSIPCGGPVLPADYVASSSSASGSTSGTATASRTAAPTTTANAAPVAVAVQNYGLGALVGGVALLGYAL